jgi:UDP-N-acetylmuramate: L-alanyl-gamma-D-glutamyl-meso-diaminopimelate ligase
VASFGSTVSDFSARGEPHDFEVLQRGQVVAHVQWELTGMHNQLNALAAMAAAEHVGVAPAQAAQALARFQNVRRRMELRGQVRGISVYDDFAHHPTALRTTLDGLRRRVGPEARILAAFEPRSNTMKLGTMKAQLPWALASADLAFCHTAGLDWDAAEALAPMGARASTAADVDQLVTDLVVQARPGDHIVCMSNGSFGGIHAKLLNKLSN